MSNNVNSVKHNHDNKKNKKKRIAILLGLLIPLLVLFSAAGTITGLYFSGVFSTTKTNIKTIFQADTAHWADDVATKGVTGYIGEGWVWTPICSSPVDSNEVRSFLATYSATTSYASVLDQIDITVPSLQSAGAWYQSTITAKPTSREYEGDFKVYFYYDNSQRDLDTDLSTRNIDLSSNNEQNVSLTTIFNAFKNATNNQNLNTDQINFQYYDANNINPWQNWNSANNFGNSSTDALHQWNPSTDSYGSTAAGKNLIRIAPKAGGIYDGDSPINVSIKLFRPSIVTAAGTEWKQNWSNYNTFYADPTPGSFLTKFDEAYNAKSWYTGKLSSTDYDYLIDTYNFTIPTGETYGVFTITGNPFYATQNDATATADNSYKFTFVPNTTVDVSTVLINSTDQTISTLNNSFYQSQGTPSVEDVKLAITQVLKSGQNPKWNQIDIIVDPTYTTGGVNGRITLKGWANSLFYTTTAMYITYTWIP